MSHKTVYKHGVSSAILAAGDTTLVEFETGPYTHMGFQLSVATQALDNFDLFIRCHESGPWQDITPANWASLAATDYHGLLYSSGNLAALAAAASGYFELQNTGVQAVQIKVSAAVDGAIVSWWASFDNEGEG